MCYLAGGLAHAAAAAILLVILLLGALCPDAGDQVTQAERTCDCVGDGLLCLVLDVCGDPNR